MREFCCDGCEAPEIDTPLEGQEREWLASTMALCHLREVGTDLDDLREFLHRSMALGFVDGGLRITGMEDAIRIYERWAGMTVEAVFLSEEEWWDTYLSRVRLETCNKFDRIRSQVDTRLEYMGDDE